MLTCALVPILEGLSLLLKFELSKLRHELFFFKLTYSISSHANHLFTSLFVKTATTNTTTSREVFYPFE